MALISFVSSSCLYSFWLRCPLRCEDGASEAGERIRGEPIDKQNIHKLISEINIPSASDSVSIALSQVERNRVTWLKDWPTGLSKPFHRRMTNEERSWRSICHTAPRLSTQNHPLLQLDLSPSGACQMSFHTFQSGSTWTSPFLSPLNYFPPLPPAFLLWSSRC